MYEPTEWKKGDVVTSAKLNKLEQGVANAVLVVNATIEIVDEATIITLDKTWQEIADAPLAVIKLVDPEATNSTFTYTVGQVYANEYDGTYGINAMGMIESIYYECDDPDGYPSVSIGGGGGGGDDDPPTT